MGKIAKSRDFLKISLESRDVLGKYLGYATSPHSKPLVPNISP